ncbi:hypothetical protein EDC01DRAFT_659472 [Geopyxis carbonaria]|nr:hypothetical protein EDC01DRAFT_659472 [Geopyxis carbonaria]
MRPSLRLLTARAPFTPTGLTGVLTHPQPKPTLMAICNQTLSVLSTLPPHSVYRQSAESITKSRLAAISSIAPSSIPAPDLPHLAVVFRRILAELATSPSETKKLWAQAQLQHWTRVPPPAAAAPEILPNQTIDQASSVTSQADFTPETPAMGTVSREAVDEDQIEVPLELDMTAEEVSEAEGKIGEGLIEEVIEQAWAELRCAEAMKESAVWEPLEVQPEEGQWVAFERTPAEGKA